MDTVRKRTPWIRTWAGSQQKTHQLKQAHGMQAHTGSRKMEERKLLLSAITTPDTDKTIMPGKTEGSKKRENQILGGLTPKQKPQA